ncbi:MAG: carbon starvation protein A, partial [Spirochaetaceae bacterium]|nr:carbon starvation protein A [Spirochaetaceae bacterium]
TAFAVITALILAFYNGANGKGALTLWPLFGAVNQTLAGLTLIVLTVYLKGKGGAKYLLTLFPAIFMVVMTIWALFINEGNFIGSGNVLLLVVNAIVIIIALWVAFEGFVALGKKQEA